MPSHRPLVAGTDFSPHAAHALELAVRLAGPAPIALVHVCELEVDDRDDQRLARCEAALAALVAEHQRRGRDVSGVLRSGKPWTKLDNVAADVGACLIVVGRHGAGRGTSVAIGSVADQLVRCASRPVLTVVSPFVRLEVEANEPKCQ